MDKGLVNFTALFRERGKIVLGSRREGHNVFTYWGRTWLSRLVPWQTIASTDAPFTNFRLRWLTFGAGYQVEDRSVLSLQDGKLINSTSYLWPLTSTGFSFPTVSSVKILSTLAPADDIEDDIISEAGLVVDRYPVASGSSAVITTVGGVTTVSGLTGMTLLSVGRFLNITNGSNPGWFRILTWQNSTTVTIDPAGAGTGTNWTESLYSTDRTPPVVAYKSFEKMVKLSSFELEIGWELKF